MVRRLLVLAFVLVLPSIALAQDTASRFDWKPVIATAAGAAMDTISTHRFTSNGSGCVEATATFTQGSYTSAAPNFGKMWTYDAVGVASVVAVNGAAHLAVRRNPESRAARWFSLVAKGYGYGAGAWRGAAAYRNIRDCGW